MYKNKSPNSKKTEFKNDIFTFLKVSLIYNIILVLGFQYFYRQHSIKSNYMIMVIIPYTIQYTLVVYLFFIFF